MFSLEWGGAITFLLHRSYIDYTSLQIHAAVISIQKRGRLAVDLARLRDTLASVVSLRELRRAKVLSQRELASRAKVSQKTIVDIETGKIRPHPSTLRKLAEALGVDPEALAEHLGD